MLKEWEEPTRGICTFFISTACCCFSWSFWCPKTYETKPLEVAAGSSDIVNQHGLQQQPDKGETSSTNDYKKAFAIGLGDVDKNKIFWKEQDFLNLRISTSVASERKHQNHRWRFCSSLHRLSSWTNLVLAEKLQLTNSSKALSSPWPLLKPSLCHRASLRFSSDTELCRCWRRKKARGLGHAPIVVLLWAVVGAVET